MALLSCNLCQGLLENYFSCQWQRGGTSDNPNAAEFGCNTNHFSISITHANTAGTENSLIDDLSHKWLSSFLQKALQSQLEATWIPANLQEYYWTHQRCGLSRTRCSFKGVCEELPTVKTELTKLGIMLLCLLATELTKLGIVLLCLL